MITAIERCMNAHDIRGLRYIFVDSLDVDPTFEKYKKDYEKCEGILFEPHKNLNDLTDNQSQWNMDYWILLKENLMQNFSKKRFEHMQKVAKVVYAEKVARLNKERKQVQVSTTDKNNINQSSNLQEHKVNTSSTSKQTISLQEQENKRVKAIIEKNEKDYQLQKAIQESKKKNQIYIDGLNEDSKLKKVKGIAPIIIVVAMIVLIILLVQLLNH